MKPEPGPNTTQGQEERFRCGPVRSGWPLRSTPNWSKSSDGSHPPNSAPWVSPQRCRRRSIWRPNPGGTGSTVPSAKTPIWTPIWRGPISTDSRPPLELPRLRTAGGMKASMPWSNIGRAAARKKADGMPISASGNTLFTPAEISSNTSGPLWKELSASTARHERPQPSCPIIRFPTGWTPREKRSATVLANISSPICCGTDTATTASSARIGASRTTIPASRRLTANAGEWRH